MRGAALALLIIGLFLQPGPAARPVLENLGRGVVRVRIGETSAFVSWRLLGTDPPGTSFNVYRAAGGGRPVKLSSPAITATTDFVDTTADFSVANSYTVRPIVSGKELAASAAFALPAAAA